MKVKIGIVIFIVVFSFAAATSVFSQKILEALPKSVKDAMKDGLLITPQGGMVCLYSERPQGTKDFDPPANHEIIHLWGECPYDSGCTVERANADGPAIAYVGEGKSPPDLQTYTNVALEPRNPSILPMGNVDIQVDVYGLVKHSPYFFFAKGTNDPLPTTATEQQTVDTPAGDVNSQHQDTLTYTQSGVTGTPTEGEQQTCTFVAWDPYGRVFDTVSLEPLPGIRIDLIDNNTQKPVIQIEKNFDITEADGLFNILVNTPGLYKIGVDVPLTYDFIPNPPINPGYAKIYSDLYFPDTVYEEKQGVPTHHDIALVPKGEPYYSDGVEVMSNASGINMGDYWLYSGRVSHPFAFVCLVGETTNKLYGCDTDRANKFGSYQITINQSDFPEFESMVPVASKTSFPSSGINVNDPQYKTSLRNEPMFGYIEGYAKDAAGKIVPNAKVQVLYSANDRLIYEVYADANGYFKFLPQELPFIEYYLSVTSPTTQKATIISTSAFATQNKSYLESKKISLTTNREEMKLLSTSKISVKNKKYSTTVNRSTNQYIPVANQTDSSRQNNPLMMQIINAFIVIIFLLGASGAAIYFFIKKKTTY